MKSLLPFTRKNQKTRTRRTPFRSRPMVELLEPRELLSLTFSTQPVDIATGQVMQPIEVLSSVTTPVPVTLSLSEQGTSGTPLLGGTVTQMTDATTHIATFNNLFVY
jgi:hypothetical protein